MKNNSEIKEMVKQKYSEIALQDMAINASSCCGSGGCSTEVYNIITDEYSHLEGYNPDADLKLGWGLPTDVRKIKPGAPVVDLGRGGGTDCFGARHETGDTGKVIGIDFTEAMIDKARANAEKLQFNNVEFRLGDIEQMPVTSDIADVVVSNCVMNLVPDKPKAFGEIFRILKPGGHFSISDIVLDGELPEKLRKAAEMYAGCVSGAIQQSDYLQILKDAGFSNISVQKEKPIIVPNDILKNYLSEDEILAYHNSNISIRSITVYGEKKKTCCGPECC